MLFGPIPAPRTPSLHRKSVLLRDPLIVEIRRQGQNGDGQKQQRREHDTLPETFGRELLRPIAEFRCELPAQDQPEDEEDCDGDLKTKFLKTIEKNGWKFFEKVRSDTKVHLNDIPVEVMTYILR